MEQVTLAGGIAARAGGAAPGCRAGSEAVLMLRPEHVKLSAGDPGTPGSFPARVVEEVFQGAVVRYGLEAAERARLTAITPLADRLDPAAAGNAWVSWASEWAFVLPASDEAHDDGTPSES